MKSGKKQKAIMKIIKAHLIKHPTPFQLRYWTSRFDTKSYHHYKAEEMAIDYFFNGYNNRDFKIVLTKCTILNAFYSTMIFNISDVAERMMKIKSLDERLKSGDIKMVDEIARCGGKRRVYSFATKYCCLHNNDAFPIYDKKVCAMLNFINKKNEWKFISRQTSTAQDSKMKTDYQYFKEVVDAFRNRFGLENYNYREIDRYLWIMGKETT